MSELEVPKKPPTVAVKKTQLTFNTYIHKTLKNVGEKTAISKPASMQLDYIIKFLSTRLSTIVVQLTNSSGRQTVNADDVEAATQIVLQGDLCVNAVEVGRQAVVSFNLDDTKGLKNKANRSGLSFPPHLSEKFLRNQDSDCKSFTNKLNISNTAPIYMAAVVECVVRQCLTLAKDVATSSKRNTINVRHLLLATHANTDLKYLLDNLNTNWIGAGSSPYIHPSLLPNPEKQRKLAAKRKKNRLELGTVVSKKALPGTKALRDIKTHQKAFGLLQAKEHFKRFVKELSVEYVKENDKLHFGNTVIETLQYFIEDKVSNVFRESINAMVHSGRETVEERDIQLVWNLLKPKGFMNDAIICVSKCQPNMTHGCLVNLSEPGLHRLATRGGVKRISQSCYPLVREIMAFYTALVLKPTVLLLYRQKAKTITLQNLRLGASMVGVNMPIYLPTKKAKKTVVSGKVGEGEVGEDEVGEDEVGEDEVGEEEVGEDEVGEDEDEVGEDEVGEDEEE